MRSMGRANARHNVAQEPVSCERLPVGNLPQAGSLLHGRKMAFGRGIGGFGASVHQQSSRATDHAIPLKCWSWIVLVGLNVIMAEHTPISGQFLIGQLARDQMPLRVLWIIAFDFRKNLAKRSR